MIINTRKKPEKATKKKQNKEQFKKKLFANTQEQ